MMLDVSRPRNEAKRSINQLKKLSKSLQNSIQNPFKIPPKPFSNRPKTLPKPIFKESRVQNASLNPFLGPLERFLVDFGGAGPPQTEPKSSKNTKKRKKNDVKKSDSFEHDLSSIFDGFGLPKRNQNEAFLNGFSKTPIL